MIMIMISITIIIIIVGPRLFLAPAAGSPGDLCGYALQPSPSAQQINIILVSIKQTYMFNNSCLKNSFCLFILGIKY